MKLFKKVTSLVIIIALISSVMVFTYGCKKEEEKKAIILIHGILGGAIYDAETDEALFALDYIDIGEVTALLGDPLGLMATLGLDENAESQHDLRMANMNDERGKYTMLSMFKALYEEIEPKYGEDYDVIIWQYDWRLDNYQSAAKLEKFVADNGYDKLIFLTHSMGGNVVSQFMANKESNKAKIELFIPFSTPFFGSADAYAFLIDGMISNVGGILNQIPMKNSDGSLNYLNFESQYNMLLSGIVNNLKPMFLELGSNLPSGYMLSPFEQFGDDPVYGEGQTPVKLDGVYKSHAEVADYFMNLPGALKSDDTLKPAYEMYEAYQAGHMVMIDGELRHISNTVNTHYIAGSGVNTLKTININTTTNKVIGNYEFSPWGDGVVTVYSSIAGNSRTAPNVYLMEGSSHVSVTTDKQCVDKALEILADFIGK